MTKGEIRLMEIADKKMESAAGLLNECLKTERDAGTMYCVCKMAFEDLKQAMTELEYLL